MSEEQVLAALREFVRERDWEKFHSPENLSKSVVIESAEMLEVFQWGGEFDRSQAIQELADVLTYCYLLAARLEVSPQEIILTKLAETRIKYPVDKSRGVSTKYDRL
jgi:NTP pyrophosphatase (non-canonical NTP hydrolase)